MKLNDLFTKEAKNAIKETLNLDEKKSINESFAAQPKKFNLKTDFLSPSNAQNHIELYEKYVKDFNNVSAQLDAVDKSEANSNHSPYRSLKIDETYNMNAAYLHELWFSNIADANSRISMDSLAYMRLNRDFGTFDDWQRDFISKYIHAVLHELCCRSTFSERTCRNATCHCHGLVATCLLQRLLKRYQLLHECNDEAIKMACY